MGMTGEQVILGFLIFETTGSTTWVGAGLAFYFLPMLIFGVPAGVVADRIDRKKILPILELLLAITLGLFGLVLYFLPPVLWQLLLMAFVTGSFRAIHSPIKSSYVYDIVGGENIVSCMGLVNLGFRMGQLLGALTAGFVLHNYGAGSAFLSLCFGHCVALLFLLRLTTVGRSIDAKVESISKNIKDYWRELCRNNTLLVLIGLTSAVEIFGFSFMTSLPELASSKFQTGAEGLGFMYSARASGGILAGIILTGALSIKYKGKLYLNVSIGFGFAVVALGVAPNLGLVLLAVAAVAAMAASTDILSQSMMQLIVPDRLRGRAMGAWMFAIGVAPLGHLEMGFLARAVSADTALIINGVVLVGICIAIYIFVPVLAKQQ